MENTTDRTIITDDDKKLIEEIEDLKRQMREVWALRIEQNKIIESKRSLPVAREKAENEKQNLESVHGTYVKRFNKLNEKLYGGIYE